MQDFNLFLAWDKCLILNKQILIPMPKLVIQHLEPHVTVLKGGLHQHIGAIVPNGWQKAIFYLYCKNCNLGAHFS
jgi:hypothetical protein